MSILFLLIMYDPVLGKLAEPKYNAAPQVDGLFKPQHLLVPNNCNSKIAPLLDILLSTKTPMIHVTDL